MSGVLVGRGTSGPSSVSGSENYIVKWGSGGVTLSNTSIYETGGDVGIGTTSPGAKLDISGTLKTSSTVTFSSFNANNNVLYATVTSGLLAGANTSTPNFCLVSGASAPSWGSCFSGGTGSAFWNQSSGALFPNNSTVDLLIGGQSSVSAKFTVLNVNNGTPTASISANSGNIATYLTGLGNLQTTNGQTLTLGGTTTGLININNKAGSAFITFDTINSRLGIGTSNPVANLHNGGGTLYGTLAVADKPSGGDVGTAATTVDIYTSVNLSQTTSSQTITLPSPTNTTAGRLIYLSNTGTVSFTFLSSAVLTGQTTAAIWDGDSWNLAGGGGLLPGTVDNSTLRWNSGSSQWLENTSVLTRANPTAAGSIGLAVTNSGAVTGTGYGLSVTKTGASTTNVAGYFSASGATNNYGLIVENGSVGIGTTTPTALLDVNGTASIAGALKLYTTPTLQSTANQTLTLGGDTTGNIAISPNNGGAGSLLTINSLLLTLSGTTTLTASSLATFTTAATLGMASTTTLNLGSNVTINSGATALNLQTDGAVDVNIAGGSGTTGCTVANSTGNLTCSGNIVGSSTGTQGYWQRTLGSLAPTNITDDLLLGATSTTSSKFAFLNVAGGTPTASISANSGNNATTLTGLGVLGTTNMQTLTLGNSTTGNIVIDSGSGVVNLADSTASRFILTDASKNLTYSGLSSVLLDTLTDETGTGVAVFGTSPDITTSLTTGSSSFNLINATATTINFAGASTTLTIGGTTGTAAVRNPTLELGGTGAATIQTNSNDDLTITPNGTGNLILTGDFDTRFLLEHLVP
ncbi:MAG: hypothetical protein HYV40_00600 [Candidatus Levybacteria bacterium]|nr:hypothetical protein [Candidatus Levybacteria bacterium]